MVRTFEGAGVAVFTPDGKLGDAFVVRADEGFRVPLPIGPLSIYPLRGDWHGLDLNRNAWSDVTSVCRTGSVMLRVGGGQTTVLYVSDNRPLEPRTIGTLIDRVAVRVSELGQGFAGPGHLYRVEIRVPGPLSASIVVALGGVPTRAAAWLATPPSDAAAATMFAVETAGLLVRRIAARRCF